MIKINTEKALNNAENLKKNSSSQKVFFDSLAILKPTQESWKRKLFLLVIEAIAAIIMAKQVNTISMTKDIVMVLITILIALLAIVFTGYAFFQALINDKLLVVLLSVDDEKKGNLSNTNKYFAEVMVFQLFCLLMNLGAIIATIIMPPEWFWLSNNVANEILASILIICLLHCNVESICEMGSFIFNVFQLFNLHAYSRMVEINENENGK
ncbi:hypothetical protein JQM64_00190 [Fournierella massiliensis]|nr:hypothetical protein [Fournierella massiliensis]MCF2555969.1 hypothetical protein [Fournierella massiliensis]